MGTGYGCTSWFDDALYQVLFITSLCNVFLVSHHDGSFSPYVFLLVGLLLLPFVFFTLPIPLSEEVSGGWGVKKLRKITQPTRGGRG